MNNETIRRIMQTGFQNSRPQFNIRLSDFGHHEKVRYVEYVYANLIESRFGFAPVDLLFIGQSELSEPEAAIFYDPCAPKLRSSDIFVAPRAAKRNVGLNVKNIPSTRSGRQRKPAATMNIHTANSSPNQGRGSPKHRRCVGNSACGRSPQEM
jgi:hypothetical protein